MQAPQPLLPLAGTLLLTVAGAPKVAVPMGGYVDLVYFVAFPFRVAQLRSGTAERVAAEMVMFQAKIWEAVQATADAIVPPTVARPASATNPRDLANFKSIVANFAPATNGAKDKRGKFARRAVLVKQCPISTTRSRLRITVGDWLPAHADADQVPAKGGSIAEQVAVMAEWADYIASATRPMLYLWRHSEKMEPWPAAAASGDTPSSSKRRKVGDSADFGAGFVGDTV
jgi:hypothetical protein